MAGFTQLAAIAYDHVTDQGRHDKWSSGGLATHVGGNFSGGDGTGGNHDDGGSNLHVQTPCFWGDLNDSEGFTIEFVAKRTDSNDTRAVLGSSEDSRLFGAWVTSAGTALWLSLGGTSSGVGRNNWAIAADLFDTEQSCKLVWDATFGAAVTDNIELFVGDVSQGTKTFTWPFDTDSGGSPGDDGVDSPIWIGRNQESSGLSKWDMWFGHIRNVKLTVGTTVKADWSISETSGNTIADSSGNGNDGTLSTFTGDAYAWQTDEFWRFNNDTEQQLLVLPNDATNPFAATDIIHADDIDDAPAVFVRGKRTADSGTWRVEQPGRHYALNGTTDKIEWVTANDGTHYLSYLRHSDDTFQTATLTYSTDRYVFQPGAAVDVSNLKHWTDNTATADQKSAVSFSSIPSNLFSWHWCEEGTGTGTNADILDASGQGNTGVLTATIAAFFLLDGTNDQKSFANDVGYTLSDGSSYYHDSAATQLIESGVLIPTHPTETGKCVAYVSAGVLADLQFSGPVPRSLKASGFGCLTTQLNTFVDCQQPVIPAASDFELSFLLKCGTASCATVVSQYQSGQFGRISIIANQATNGTEVSGLLNFFIHAGLNISLSGLTVDGSAWQRARLSRVGNAWAMSIETPNGEVVDSDTYNGALSPYQGRNFAIGSLDDAASSLPFTGSICNVQCTDKLDLPCTDGGGPLVANLVDGQPHPIITGVLASAWANTQDVYGRELQYGAGRRMWFDGVDDYVRCLDSSGLDPGTNDFTLAIRGVFFDTGGPQMNWLDRSGNGYRYILFYVGVDLKVYLDLGGVVYNWVTGGSITFNEYFSFLVSVDRDGNATPYINGVAGTVQDVSADAANDVVMGDELFLMQRFSGGNLAEGMLIAAAIWNDRALSESEASDWHAGSLPAGSSFSVTNKGNSLTDWTDESGSSDADLIGGSPDQSYFPADTTDPTVDALTGLPLTNGPGKMFGSHLLDVQEANAPWVLQLPSTTTDDLPYGVGDDDNDTDTVLARVQDSGDDRIAIYDPALTGSDLTEAQDYHG